MNNINQHIKNFFQYLNKRENREIPILYKVLFFPNILTKEDFDELFYNSNPYYSVIRTKYFNNITSNNFYHVNQFGKYDKNIAFAILSKNQFHISYFINKKGEFDVENIDINKLINRKDRDAYLNSLKKKEVFYNTDSFGVIFPNLAETIIIDLEKTPNLENMKLTFVDKNGTITDIDLDPNKLKKILLNPDTTPQKRATFLNIFIKKPLFYNISNYGVVAKNIALALYSERPILRFINLNGEPDLTGINFKTDIYRKVYNRQLSLNYLLSYFNTIQNKYEYEYIDRPDMIGLPTNLFRVYKCYPGEHQPIFINEKGLPSLNGIDLIPDNIKNKYEVDISNTKELIDNEK